MISAPLPHLQHSGSNTHSKDPQLRLYQVWKGSNRFICGGRLIFGPDVPSIFLTLFLIVAPVITFWAFVAQGVVNAFSHKSGIIIIVISVFFSSIVIFLLFFASSRDPGIIPRNSRPPEDHESDSSSLSADWISSQTGGVTFPLTKNVTVNGMIVKVKYCPTCKLYRPPRCSHCSICNNCVERFDHHCPWVGQCIGKRNYRYFFMFVGSTTMLCLYIHAFCWINVKRIIEKEHCDVWKAFLRSPASGILIIYTLVVAWFVGGLTSFHIYLVVTNQTTYENFRHRYTRKMNPYNIGCIGNFKEVFMSKIPKSRNNFRKKVGGNSSTVSNSSCSDSHLNSDMQNRSFNIETGKRQPVDVEEFEDVQFSRLERCETQPRHSNGDMKNDREIRPDIHILATEFGNGSCGNDREKMDGDH